MSAQDLPFTQSNRLITRERLVTALIFALLAHGVILLGVGFVSLVPKPSHNRYVDVTLVRDTDTVPPPRRVDYIAQANQRGPGNRLRLDAPIPALGSGDPLTPSQVEPDAAFRNEAPSVEQLLQAASQAASPARPMPEVAASPNGERAVASAHRRPDIARPALVMRLVAPNRAAATHDDDLPIVTLPQVLGRHPEKNASTTNAIAASSAAYLTRWRSRVQVVGDEHYRSLVPASIEQGHVTLTVSLDADGTIHAVRILRHSRYPALDAAVLKMIRLAAPFPPFPSDLRKLTSRLTFTYRWNYSRKGFSTGSVGAGND